MHLKLAVFVSFYCLTSVTSRHHHHREPPQEDDALLFWKMRDAKPCQPFTVFYIKCNKCVCATDGSTSCTRHPCFENEDDQLQVVFASD